MPTTNRRPRRRRPRGPWLIGLGIVVALVLGVVAVQRAGDRPATLTPAEINSTVSSVVEKGIDDAQNAPPPSATAFQTIQPLARVHQRQAARRRRRRTRRAAPASSSTPTGQILTARHVVTGAESIQVTFADGTPERGPDRVRAGRPTTSPSSRPAPPPSVIVPAVLGGGVQVGDDVYAVGHPLGLVDSLTAGVVSGLNRTIPVAGGTALNGLIQFDAAVNPGNSGGPLLNRAGQVVGIVTALANPSDQAFFVGIGFAVPIATAGGAAGAPQQ